jgi:hypothetical protein
MGSAIGTLLITMVPAVVAMAAAPWRAGAGETDGDTEGPLPQPSEFS